jgi:hypothetical protein
MCCRRRDATLYACIVARIPFYMCVQQCATQLHIHLYLLDCWRTTHQGYVQSSAVYYKISWQIINSVTGPFSSDAMLVLTET